MSDLLSRLSGTPKSKPIEPREIFMSLPTKDKQYEYPRDVQAEVWKKWFDRRNQKNTIIKMNTGSGKTVVGLMILQSCLNEGKGPAVYAVPDNYLVAQVCDEARKLGILAVTDKDDYHYSENKAILVVSIHTLVNGRSAFGMRSYSNYPIGSVLLDDVHACFDKITSQFSVKIPLTHELYKNMIALFADSWKAYDSSSYTDIVEMQDPHKNALLPFWLWQDKQTEVYRLLKQYDNGNEENKCVFFSLPLLQDCLSFCNCVITARSIEISPKGIPISKISSFEEANRRIFMSATLADDSVFVSAIGLKPDQVSDIITPDKANDIGDRLILFPRHLNSSISDSDIKRKVIELSAKHNVVVIVPSSERGRFWDETGSRLVNKDNIEKAVAALKDRHIGLVVLINRYDGIDLPDEACRLLVIDGLPPLHSEYDKYMQSINPTSNLLLREQIQRIEQGMGRGVRSNSDSCCIVLMGSNLADVLIRNKGVLFFSNATTEQYNLSKELWDLLKQVSPSPTIDEIFELANYSLNRDVNWIEKSKEQISNVVYKTTPYFDHITKALREAFEQANVGQWQKAVEAIDTVINHETDEKSKGYLMQIKAEYTNFLDRSKAQQILQAARTFNRGTLVPIEGIQYDKLINSKEQAKSVLDYVLGISSSPNEFVIHINAVIDTLLYSPNTNDFEGALKEVGEILGFKSSRPDKETSGKGPDNLWAIGNSKYLVIECKSGATSDTISKDQCNQLGGSVRWFDAEYGNGYSQTPIMIHITNNVDSLATPPQDTRIITPDLLEKLKTQIRDFAIALAQGENWRDETKISSLLISYKLRGKDIVQEYTTAFIMKRN